MCVVSLGLPTKRHNHNKWKVLQLDWNVISDTDNHLMITHQSTGSPASFLQPMSLPQTAAHKRMRMIFCKQDLKRVAILRDSSWWTRQSLEIFCQVVRFMRELNVKVSQIFAAGWMQNRKSYDMVTCLASPEGSGRGRWAEGGGY